MRELFSLSSGESPDCSENLWLTAEIEIRYEGYLERERETVDRMKRMSDFDLPRDFPYAELLSLRFSLQSGF